MITTAVDNISQGAPIYVLFTLLFSWIFTADLTYMYFLIGFLFNGFIINYALKMIVYFLWSKFFFIYAPETFTAKCGMFCASTNNIDPSCRPVSLPSVHAQSMSFFMTFGLMYIFDNLFFIDQNILAVIFVAMFSVVTSAKHYLSGCETIIQYMAGVICGMVFGVIWFILYLNMREGFKAYHINK